MSVEQVLRILYPGVKGLLNQQQATNLVLSFIILATEPVDTNTLRFFARFLTPIDYDELVEERMVVHRCGYPLCSNMLRDSNGMVRKVNASSVVKPWSKHYCSRICYGASQFYRQQLSTESLVTRRDVAYVPYGQMHYENNILIFHEVEHIAERDNKSIADVVRDIVKSQVHMEQAFSDLNLQAMPGTEGPLPIHEKPTQPAHPPVPGERQDE